MSACAAVSILFQSTRPLRGATSSAMPSTRTIMISIHAPLAGRDLGLGLDAAQLFISIHAPLAGRDDVMMHVCHVLGFISIHAPLAGRDAVPTFRIFSTAWISIHAPLAGRDGRATASCRHCREFQSTRPLRGATRPITAAWFRRRISIHAPLAGRDPSGATATKEKGNFNPRAPCGARPVGRDRNKGERKFQSTRPLRGATIVLDVLAKQGMISIHAPLAGRDPYYQHGVQFSKERFQSTRPLRGATIYWSAHGWL